MREPTANPSDEFLKHYRKSNFASIAGWQDDDHIAALACFRVSARKLLEQSYKQGAFGPPIADLSKIASASLDATYGGRLENSVARNFFEEHFVPYRYLGDTPTAKRIVLLTIRSDQYLGIRM